MHTCLSTVYLVLPYNYLAIYLDCADPVLLQLAMDLAYPPSKEFGGGVGMGRWDGGRDGGAENLSGVDREPDLIQILKNQRFVQWCPHCFRLFFIIFIYRAKNIVAGVLPIFR